MTEQIAEVIEVSYDVDLPAGVGPDDVEEHLDRENDEVRREVVRSHREITGVEEITP